MSFPESRPVLIEPAPRRRQSVFGNFTPVDGPGDTGVAAATWAEGDSAPAVAADAELALLRSFLHQFLARAFDYPSEATWAWMSADSTRNALSVAVAALEPDSPGPLRKSHVALNGWLAAGRFEEFHDDYITAIGHAARGSCPANEIEYGDIKADPLFQPHRLADLAAFYRAFGMETAASGERHDHLSVELEFMGVLAAQEAHLAKAAAEPEALIICREGQRKFLREHIGRWSPAFARRLHRAVGDRALGILACFALEFIQGECRRAGVRAGSEDLLLRPADESASLCDGCGINNLPPGVIPAA